MATNDEYPQWLKPRPIEAWPTELTQHRTHSPFRSKWGATSELLKVELRQLGTGGEQAPAVLQIAITEDDLRLDGKLRATARPAHPGVILSIESKHGPLAYPCDKFTSWKDNVRAIALALESLRRIDRYGITQTGQQYRGWQQLPRPGATQPPMSTESAIKVITEFAIVGDCSPTATLRQRYRRAKAITHPDRNHNDRYQWDELEHAADVLRAEGLL